MRTWIRREIEPTYDEENDVLAWVKGDDELFYVLLVSGVFKLASIVTYEGMTREWEPSPEHFLEIESAN